MKGLLFPEGLGSEAGILAPRSPEAAGRGGEVRSEETEKISLADLLAGEGN